METSELDIIPIPKPRMIKLDIIPIPKPRMIKSDAWAKRPAVLKYWEFKEKLINLFGDRELPDTFHVIFIMPMSSSWSEKRKLLFDGKPHQQKPDADNLGKPSWMHY